MTNYYAYLTKISDLHENLETGLEYVHWRDEVKPDSTVFVKPNFTYPFHKPGITTTPQMLEILLGILKDRADRVIVGESDGGNHSFTADEAFNGHNMHEICNKTGCELVNLSTLPSVDIEEKIQGKKVKVQAPKLLLNDIDCSISVPVLKVHAMTTITLAMKNLWGCHPDTMRCLHHKNLAHKLTLLTKIINPKLVVIDGTYGLDGHGPMHGTAKKLDILAVTNNPVVSDIIGTKIMGFDPKKISHVEIAKRELLSSDFSFNDIQINDDIANYSQKFEVKKTTIDHLSRILFNSELAAKIVMDSPLKPIAYGIGTKFRNKDEQKVNEDLENK